VIAAFMRELAAAGVDDVTLPPVRLRRPVRAGPMIPFATPATRPIVTGCSTTPRSRRFVTEHLVGGKPVDALLIGS